MVRKVEEDEAGWGIIKNKSKQVDGSNTEWSENQYFMRAIRPDSFLYLREQNSDRT